MTPRARKALDAARRRLKPDDFNTPSLFPQYWSAEGRISYADAVRKGLEKAKAEKLKKTQTEKK